LVDRECVVVFAVSEVDVVVVVDAVVTVAVADVVDIRVAAVADIVAVVRSAVGIEPVCLGDGSRRNRTTDGTATATANSAIAWPSRDAHGTATDCTTRQARRSSTPTVAVECRNLYRGRNFGGV
jgi:hypothetical protein